MNDAWDLQPAFAPAGSWPYTLPGTGGAVEWLRHHGLASGMRLGVVGSNCPAIGALLQAASLLGVDVMLGNRRLLPHELQDQCQRLPCTAMAVGADATPPSTVRAIPLPDTFADGPLPASGADAGELVIWSSGTSGPAKPIRLPWARLQRAADAARVHLGLTPSDRWLACLPVDHIGGASMLLRAAWSGCRVRLHRRFSVEHIDDELDGITGISLVPTMLHRLVERRAGRPWPASLRCLLIGGAPLPHDLARACRDLGLAPCATYGLSEAASMACAQRPGEGNPPGRCGSPLPGIEVRIAEAGGDGVGIIALRGAHLTPGYEQDWLLTGDLGRLHADGLEVLGRRDEVIISGGEKIAPDQIEGLLLSHPSVADAVVGPCPDPEWGQIVGALLVARGAVPDPDAWQAWLDAQCAGFRRPRRWRWVSECPRTSLGKPRRAAVAALLSAASSP